MKQAPVTIATRKCGVVVICVKNVATENKTQYAN